MSLTRIVNSGKFNFPGLLKLMDFFLLHRSGKKLTNFPLPAIGTFRDPLSKIRRAAFQNVASRVYAVHLTECFSYFMLFLQISMLYWCI